MTDIKRLAFWLASGLTAFANSAPIEGIDEMPVEGMDTWESDSVNEPVPETPIAPEIVVEAPIEPVAEPEPVVEAPKKEIKVTLTHGYSGPHSLYLDIMLFGVSAAGGITSVRFDIAGLADIVPEMTIDHNVKGLIERNEWTENVKGNRYGAMGGSSKLIEDDGHLVRFNVQIPESTNVQNRLIVLENLVLSRVGSGIVIDGVADGVYHTPRSVADHIVIPYTKGA